MPENIMDSVIDLGRARAAGACAQGLAWAELRPSATVRDLFYHRSDWGAWYASRVLGMEDAALVRLLGGELRLSDDGVLRAVVGGVWEEDRAVHALDAAWGDDTRVAGALWRVGAVQYLAYGLCVVWEDDERVALALGHHMADEMLVKVLGRLWLDRRLAEAVGEAWQDDDRVRKALGGAWNDEARVFRALQKLEPKGASNV
jgi:hypothetical protein